MIFISIVTILLNLPIQEAQNKIVFYNIDDFAKLIVNDLVIYQNKSNENAPDIYKEINLDPYLNKGENKVIIKLNNQPCDDCPYNPWSLGFEIHKNGEYHDDYFKESNGEDEIGGEKIVWKYDWKIE